MDNIEVKISGETFFQILERIGLEQVPCCLSLRQEISEEKLYARDEAHRNMLVRVVPHYETFLVISFYGEGSA